MKSLWFRFAAPALAAVILLQALPACQPAGVVDRAVEVGRIGGVLSTRWAFRVERTLKGQPSGELFIEATLSTGKHGPGKVILSVNRAGLPEGLIVDIEKAEFTAYPRSEYTATMVIAISPDLPPGSYRIPM